MKHFKSSYQQLRGEKNYFLYLLYCVFSRLGDSIDAIVFSWIAYEITGSAAWLAIIAGVNALPTIFLTPLIAPLVERWQKKPVIVITSILRSVLVGLVGLLMLLGQLQALHLLFITFAISVLESFSDPAFMACMPTLIPPEKLDAGIALRSIVSQSCNLLGASLGGVLIGLLGSGLTLTIDALLFFLGALPLLFLHFPLPAANAPTAKKESYFSAFRNGFSYFIQNPALLALCVIGVVFNVLAGPIDQMQSAGIIEILHLDAFALSVSGAAMSGGMFIGSFLYPMLSSRLSLRRILFVCGLAMSASYGGIVLLGMLSSPLAKLFFLGLLFFAFALCVSLFSVMSNILFFKVIDSTYLARMASIFNAFAMLSTPISSVYGGTLANLFSLRSAFLVCCVATLLVTLFATRLPILRKIEEITAPQSNLPSDELPN